MLLVSEIPMFSMKFKKNMKPGDHVNMLRLAFGAIVIASCITVAILGLNWSMTVLIAFVSYIILNIVGLMISTRK
jgi:hypothetical protein